MFEFGTSDKYSEATQASVRAGIRSKQELMDAVFEALRLPDYFGDNWDALEECIRDLSWMPPGPVVLVHHDLPIANDRSGASTYLSILRDAALKWRTQTQEDRLLIVLFPEAVRQEVLGLSEG